MRSTRSTLLTREAHFERLFVTGNVTSPNYPGYYPFDHDKTYIIQVEQEHVLSIHFNAFDVSFDAGHNFYEDCADFLSITDGDGTSLLDKYCSGTNLPADLTSTSNMVKILFHTNHEFTKSGWSLYWTAVKPGEQAL